MTTENVNGSVGKDLIAQKTAEFENLPGLILGLDGWILRSVPPESRESFLRGYEKLLRIVFHPDRYQQEDQKHSKMVYLQSVSEAVGYMLSDAFAFEMASDTVPTRHNPVLSLRRDLAVRDNIIAQTDARMAEHEATLEEVEKELKLTQKQLQREIEQSKKRDMLHYRIRKFIHVVAKKLPVPVKFEMATVTGSFIKFKPETEAFNTLRTYSSEESLGVEHPLASKNEWLKRLNRSDALEPEKTWHFRRSHAIKSKFQAHIIGAMTLAHLCEYIRNRTGYQATMLADDSVSRALRELHAPDPFEDHHTLPYRARMESFMLPFYCPGMMLLVQTGQTKYRLFLVRDVDAASGHHKALAVTYRKKALSAERETFRIERQLKQQKSANRHQRLVQRQTDKELKKATRRLFSMDQTVERNLKLKARTAALREELRHLSLSRERLKGQVAFEDQTQAENEKLKKENARLKKAIGKLQKLTETTPVAEPSAPATA